MKRIFCSLSIFLISLALCAQSAGNIVDEVVWVVGDEAILRSDVEHQRLMGEKVEGNPYCVIPEQIALTKLFLNQAQIDSIEVSEQQINQQVEMRLNQWVMAAGSKEKLEEYRNMSYAQLREELHSQLKDMLTMQEMRRSLTKNVRVTPAEVRNYFKDMPKDSLPMINTKVEVQIIIHEPMIPQSEIDRVKAELRDYTERVNTGRTSFQTLAKLYSQDPGSARLGGEMDYMGRGMLDPAFANVAFSLNEPGKVSKIVKSEYGYHIIQLVDKRGDKVKVRHILRQTETDMEQLSLALERLDSLGNDIREGKLSFEDGVQIASDDKDTRNNKGIMSNVYADEDAGEMVRTTKFEMKDLPVEIARVIENMEVGEVSKAFTMTNKKGADVCALVKLKSRTEQHRASMSEDFQKLQQIVLDRRQEEHIQKWIREKQKSTYVRINPEWRNCDFRYPGWIVE